MLPTNISASSVANTFGENVYTDLHQLNNINRLADKDQDAALKKMAQQFEGLFLQVLLKTMREASSVFTDKQSSEMNFHQSMFDNQLALTMSSGQGIGLADSFYQQMIAHYAESDAAEKLTGQLDTNLNSSFNNRIVKNQPAAPLKKDIIPTDPQAFVDTLYPYAKTIADQLGVDPAVIVAQSALETGWGKYVINDKYGRSSYNLFNIKADKRWSGGRINVATVEYKDGLTVRENANFRRYQNISESFTDYAQFILNEPRYHSARQAQDDREYLRALQSSGYATDPHYADKIIALLDHELIRDRTVME